MHLFISLAIFTLSNSFFYLFSWSQIHGIFNTSDIGLFLIAFSLPIAFFRCREKRILANSVSMLICFQLLYCVFHIFFVVARFNYSLFNAIVASRSFLYYCSFFVFLLLIDTRKKAVKTLGAMNLLLLLIMALSVVNYAGPTIFYHEWAAGHAERADIKRAFIPGMPVMSMMAIWAISCAYTTRHAKLSWNVQSLLYTAAHVFRQSRMRLFGVLACLLGMGLYQRKFLMTAAALGLIGATSLGLAEIFSVDILGKNVELTITDISKSSGTYEVRRQFIMESMKEFMESPIIGTGGSAIRPFEGAYKGISQREFQKYLILGKQTDIGILNWIKDFGLIGLAWFVVFFMVLFRLARHALKNPDEDRRLSLFSAFFLLFVLVTSGTLEHLINSSTIPPVMFISALLVRMRLGWRKEEQACPAHLQP